VLPADYAGMLIQDEKHAIDRASDGLLTKRERATKLKVSVRTLDDWMRRGRIAYLKVGFSARVVLRTLVFFTKSALPCLRFTL
jgi:hypothetical protein